jgi:hypothetical protein
VPLVIRLIAYVLAMVGGLATLLLGWVGPLDDFTLNCVLMWIGGLTFYGGLYRTLRGDS